MIRVGFRRFGLRFIPLLLLAMISLPAFGQEGLYGAGAPDDAAVVRVVHASAHEDEVSTSIGGADFGPLAYAAASPYRPIAPDLYMLSIADLTAELVAEVGAYYTIVLRPDELLVFEDAEHTDPARAQVFLYNLSSLPEVKLVANGGPTDVTGFVAPGKSEEAVVAAVPVELTLVAGDDEIEPIGDPGLERGESYSVFVITADEDVKVFLVQAEVAAG
jgi:alginate O-acetyltransferase complex protein AlgF